MNISRSSQTYKLRLLINNLFSKIFPHGISQLVSGPTRHFPGQKSSGLDHLYTNAPDKICNVEKHFCGGSDHMLITASRKSSSIKNSPQYIRKRSFKLFNPECFITAVRNISWLNIYLCEDVNTALNILTNELNKILDVMAPMKTVQIRKHRNNWSSQETLCMMKQRDYLQKTASETNCKNTWKQYKLLRNKINNKLKFEEKCIR